MKKIAVLIFLLVPAFIAAGQVSENINLLFHWKNDTIPGSWAFDNAYRKECNEIINKIREIANDASEPDDIWRLCDFLDEKSKEIGIKYDYRYSVLIPVFARLLK